MPSSTPSLYIYTDDLYIYIHTLVLSPGKKCPHAAYMEPTWHLLLMLCKPWLDSLSMENQWLLCMYVTLHVVRVNRCIYWCTLVWKVFSTSHGCFDICGITVCVYVCRQIWSGRTFIVEATTGAHCYPAMNSFRQNLGSLLWSDARKRPGG